MSEQQYILRKPVTAEVALPFVYVDFGVDGDVPEASTVAWFDEVFQPLDRETLTQQIENLLQDHGARFYADHEIDRIAYGEHKTSEDVQGEQENEARREFASTVVGLLYPEKSEQT